jgi:Caenorhabditis protein of unknown function, DUF268
LEAAQVNRSQWKASLLTYELREVKRTVGSGLRQVRALPGFGAEHRRFVRALRRAGSALPVEPFPQLDDRTSTTPYDTHYVHQGPWVMRHLVAHPPARHVDVGSYLGYLGFFAALVPTEFIDIRPPHLEMSGLSEQAGSLLALPYGDASLTSLSCLHVIEHVGLGRYGDPLDPDGTKLACAELARVLAPGGSLYLSLPIGRPRISFNAHRVHSTSQILELISPLKLVSLGGVLDDGTYHDVCEPTTLDAQEYACGLFHFTA